MYFLDRKMHLHLLSLVPEGPTDGMMINIIASGSGSALSRDWKLSGSIMIQLTNMCHDITIRWYHVMYWYSSMDWAFPFPWYRFVIISCGCKIDNARLGLDYTMFFLSNSILYPQYILLNVKAWNSILDQKAHRNWQKYNDASNKVYSNKCREIPTLVTTWTVLTRTIKTN